MIVFFKNNGIKNGCLSFFKNDRFQKRLTTLHTGSKVLKSCLLPEVSEWLVLELEKSITNFLNLLLVNDIYYINGINSRYFRNRLFSLVNEYKRNEIFR